MTSLDEDYVLVSSGTFECPVEADGTLALSTLQGQIPHANGLHYVAADANRLRAIRFDKRLGKLYPPADGWGQRIYTISFANLNSYGCLRAPIAVDRYDRATRSFRDSVDAVERLFDVGYETDQPGDNKAMDRLKQEVARLRSKNRELENEKRKFESDLEEKDKRILSLLSEMPGPEYVTGDNDFINQAMRMVQEKENELSRVLIERDYLKSQLERYQQQGEIDTISVKSVGKLDKEPLTNGITHGDDLDMDVESLRSQLAEAKTRIEHLEHQLEDANFKHQGMQGELQERISLFQDLTFRADALEASVKLKDSELTELRHLLADKETALNYATQDLEEIKMKCQDMERLDETRRNSESENENDLLRSQCRELEANIVTAETDNRALHQEIGYLKEKIIDLEEHLEAAKQRERDIVQNSENAVTTVHPFQTTPDYVKLSEESSKLRQQLASVTEKCNHMEADLTQLRDTEEQLNESLVATKRELEDSRWRRGELEAMMMGGAVDQTSYFRLDESKRRISELLQEIARLKRLHDEALWRVSKAEAEMNGEAKQLQETRQWCDHLQAELNNKNEQLQQTDFKIRELETQVKNAQNQLENRPVEYRGADEKVFTELNNSKNHITWLESQLAHYKHLFHDTGAKVNHLQSILDSAHRHLWDAFVIRKEPYIDRHRWNLSMWHEGSDEHYVRVWYELDAPKAKSVYLATSYYNWECLLLMSWHEHQKWGVWVDAPKGRHEFSFYVDGEFKTSDQYSTCHNDVGSLNNWREVQ